MNACAAIALTCLIATSAGAQPSVGVSIDIHQPGVYGRIDIGHAPPPPLVYARPIIIERAPVRVRQAPVYLYVRPGHQKHWARHCGAYGACGQPVYFVQERWIRERHEARDGGRPHGHKDKKDKKAKKGRSDD